MKRLVKGFTLAEALITLAIIGVIATISLPTLNANVAKSQAGPALMKAINTLESANMMAIKTNNVRRLTQVDTSGDAYYFDEIVGPYINFKNKASVTYGSLALQGYTLNDGMLYGRVSDNTPVAVSGTAPSRYDGKYYVVYVDTNGYSKGPNMMGKDLFKLVVDTKGYVIPYGGEAYKDYTGSTSTVWSSSCNRTTVSDAESCTGSIVDNGGKIIYPYNFAISAPATQE